jgi:hypothetical protein
LKTYQLREAKHIPRADKSTETERWWLLSMANNPCHENYTKLQVSQDGDECLAQLCVNQPHELPRSQHILLLSHIAKLKLPHKYCE